MIKNTQRKDSSFKVSKTQTGVSTTEFVIVSPIAILFTLATIQAGFAYMAKSQVNHATFMAARHGATKNANQAEIQTNLIKSLIPFYQDSFESNELIRISKAYAKANLDSVLNLKVERLSPNKEAFDTYGISKPGGGRYIPNNNLEYRNPEPIRSARVSIHDANILRIKVTYGYDIKVPLMGAVIKRVMCPFLSADSDIKAWSKPSLIPMGSAADCAYFMRGKIPIVSFATVQMQTDPIEDSASGPVSPPAPGPAPAPAPKPLPTRPPPGPPATTPAPKPRPGDTPTPTPTPAPGEGPVCTK
jgi:TadE-like protein